MKLSTLVLMASTALVPTIALAQAQAPATTSQRTSATQATSAADFVNKAAASNLFEIQSSQLALQKSQNNRVREFAQRMVQDHTAAGDRLKAAAQAQNVRDNLDQQHASALQQLQGASGADFDRRYVQHQLTGHEETVGLFDHFAQNGDHPQLKQFAQQTLPSLREHLQMAQQLRSALPPEQTAQAPGMASTPKARQIRPASWSSSRHRRFELIRHHHRSRFSSLSRR
jgi:putative membrane protein